MCAIYNASYRNLSRQNYRYAFKLNISSFDPIFLPANKSTTRCATAVFLDSATSPLLRRFRSPKITALRGTRRLANLGPFCVARHQNLPIMVMWATQTAASTNLITYLHNICGRFCDGFASHTKWSVSPVLLRNETPNTCNLGPTVVLRGWCTNG